MFDAVLSYTQKRSHRIQQTGSRTNTSGETGHESVPGATKERLGADRVAHQPQQIRAVGVRLALRLQFQTQLLLHVVRRRDQQQLAPFIVQEVRRVRRHEPPIPHLALEVRRVRRATLPRKPSEAVGRAPAAAALFRVLDLDEVGGLALEVERLQRVILGVSRRELELVDQVGVHLPPGLVPKNPVHSFCQGARRRLVAVAASCCLVLLCVIKEAAMNALRVFDGMQKRQIRYLL